LQVQFLHIPSLRMQHPFLKIAISALVCVVVASSVVLNTKSTMVSASTGKIRLVYFDAKGVVEMTRIMCMIGGLEFEDSRYTIKVKDGGGFETPEFAIAKENGDLLVWQCSQRCSHCSIDISVTVGFIVVMSFLVTNPLPSSTEGRLLRRNSPYTLS
jgi:hypothetical protein